MPFSGLPNIISGGGYDIAGFIGIEGLSQFKRDLDQAEKSADKAAKAMNRGLTVAMAAGAAAIGASVAAAVQFQSSFAGVIKTVDGLDDGFGGLTDEGEKMARAFRDLSLVVPISVNELNKIGELGGQLGIAKTDLLSFTDTIARLGVATDMTVEAAATEMARFVNITQQVAPAGMGAADQIERIGSTIVALGNSSATTESEISAMAQRLAGAGAQIGLTQADILGMSAALTSVGINAEAGGTAFSKMFSMIAGEVETNGSKLEQFAAVAGMTAEQFSAAFKNDAADAISSFVIGLGSMDEVGQSALGTLADMDLTEIRLKDSLLRSAGASDLFNTSLENAREAYAANNALMIESEKRFATFESQMILVKNIFYDAAIELGNKFLPALQKMAEFFIDNADVVIKMAINLGEMLAAMGAIAAGVKFVNFLKTLPALFATLNAAMGPVGLIIMGIVAAFFALKTAWDVNLFGMRDTLGPVFKSIGGFFVDLWNIVEPIFSAIWDIFVTWNKGVFNIVAAPIKALFGMFDINFSGMRETVGTALDYIVGGLSAFGTFLADIAGRYAEVLGGVATILEGVFTLNMDKIKEGFNKAAEAIAGDWGNTFDQVKSSFDVAMGGIEEKTANTGEVIASETDKMGGEFNKLEQDVGKSVTPIVIAGEKFSAIFTDTGDAIKLMEPEFARFTDHTDELFDGIKKINPEFTEFKNTQEGLKAAYDLIRDPQTLQIEQFKKLLASGELLPGQVMAVEQAIQKLGGETKKGNTEWADYLSYLNDLIDKIPGVSGEFKSFATFATNAFTQLVQGGVDPVSLGFSALNLVLGTFMNDSPPFKRTAEEISDLFGKWGINIGEVNSSMDALMDKVNSNILDKLKKQFEAVTTEVEKINPRVEEILRQLESGATVELKVGDPNIKEINKAVKAHGDAIRAQLEYERLFYAINFTANFEDVTEGLDYLTGERNRMVALFGSGFDLSGFDEMLREQIDQSTILLDQLDPESEAFRILSQQINNAELALSGITVVIAEANPLLEENFSIVERMIPGYRAFFDVLNSNMESAFSNFYAFENSGREAISAIEDAIYFGISPQENPMLVGQTQKLIDGWLLYLATLDPKSQAFKDGSASLRILWDLYYGWLTPAVEGATYANESWNDSVWRTPVVSNPATDSNNRYADSVVRAGDAAYYAAFGTSELNAALRDTPSDSGGTFDYAADKLALFKEYGIQTRGELIAQIREVERLVGYLDQGSSEYSKWTYELGKLYEQLGVTNPYVGELTHLQWQLADAGIETTDGVKDQIDQLEALLPLLSEGSYEYQQVIDKLGPLYDKLGMVNPYLTDQAEAFLSIKDGIISLNVQTESWMKQLFGQYDEMMSMLGSFGTEGFEDSGPLFDLLRRIEEFGLSFEDTNVDEQIAAWIIKMKEYLATLDPNSDAYQKAKLALNTLIDRFQTMGGSMNLPDEWLNDFTLVDENAAMGKLNDSMLLLNTTLEKLVLILGDIPDEIDDTNGKLKDTKNIMQQVVDEALRFPGGFDFPPLEPPKHQGGLVAHGGTLIGDEIWLKARKKEMVLRPEITDAYGAQRLIEFNRTGDASVLNGGQQAAPAPVNVNVVNHNTTPETWTEITSKKIYPNIRNTQRFYETGTNPYNAKRS